MLEDYCQDPSGKKGLSSLPNSLETFQSKNQLSRQRKENHAPCTPASGSGIHIPENQIPQFTYVLYTDRKSSEKSAPSGSNDSIYSRLLGSMTSVLSHSHPQAEGKKKIPNCSFKSHSQGHPGVTKLFLQGSQGDGGGCGFLPHALSPPALERCQVRTHREMVEPPTTSATSSQPAQRQQTTPAALLWGPLYTPQVPRTNQKLLQPLHPQRNCLFLSNSKLL